MEMAPALRVFALLCIFNLYSHCAFQEISSQEEANSSCVLAEPPVNLTVKMAHCIFNSKKSGMCENIISNQYIYGDSDSLSRSEGLISLFEIYLPLYAISEGCLTILKVLYCRYLFPLCDTSLKKPHPQQICRKTCEFALHVRCKEEFDTLQSIQELDSSFDRDMINCTTFSSAVGGEAPECYQDHLLPGDDTQSTDCYHGIGLGYRGNVNTTQTGRTCQAWSSQCPHRHGRIPKDVVGGENDSNMCRNPDSSAPDGPWCYTTDPKVRWEYCNVSTCPPRVPDAAPTALKGHPINSSSIHISWEGIPPTPFKEQLLGYRVKYRRRESLSFNEVNVTSNITSFNEVNVTSNTTKAVLSRLDPMTKYEVTVNGFNEVGHGPSGKVVVVRTLQSGEIITDIKIRLVMDANFHSDLLNRSTKAFIEMEETIKSSMIRQFNASSNFKIYEINVLRFSRGSVEAHVVALVIASEHISKAEVISYLTEGFDSSFKQELAISALIVEEKPPPPGNVEVKNVQTRYMILTWDKPKYGSYYQIDNYTIERKKEVSYDFTVAQTLPYTHTGLMIKDLDPATEYTIRLSSNNKYGRSDGVLLTQSTLPDRFLKRLILIIILPLSLATFFVIAVCLKFRPTCKAKSLQTEQTVLWKRGSWLELPRSDVQLLEKLGEGAFGEAFKGRVRINGQVKLCAIKRLKENATETEKRDLINELRIMTTVGEHPNVISLIGACTEKEPVFVIVRLAQNGCLLNHLKKNRENPYVNVEERQLHFSDIDRLRIARDVADGMLHLSNKKCVHRDLATRNVLLGEDFVAMVSDFGLSRDVYESGEYENVSGGMLPVRWMALESLLDYTYNTKTDIWSFGVVLWEIESGGVMPYPGLTGMEVVDFLKSGQRLKKPTGCPDELYEMMTSCWHADPVQRPSFSDLVTSLEQQLGCRKDSLKKPFSENEEPGSFNVVSETED